LEYQLKRLRQPNRHYTWKRNPDLQE